MSKDRIVWLVTNSVLAAAAATMLVVIGWGVSKGFGIMAEGFYLLAYNDPQRYPTFSSFHFLLSKLPKLVESEIIHYRLLELLTRSLSALVLCLGFAAWLRKFFAKTESQAFILAAMICCSQVGSLLVFSCFPQCISYNGLSASVLFTAAGLIFFALATDDEIARLRRSLFCLFACGFLTGLSFFAKFSAAVIFETFTCLLLTGYCRQIKWQALLAYLAGTLAALASYFMLVEQFAAWQTNFTRAVQEETMAGSHSFSDVLVTLVTPIVTHARDLPLIVVLAIAFLAFARVLSKIKESRYSGTVCCVSAVSVTIFTTFLIRKRYFHMHESNIVILILVLEAIMLAVSSAAIAPQIAGENSGKWRRRPVVALIADERWLRLLGGLSFMAVLPLVASFGTNTGVWSHAASNLAPWFILAAAFAALIARAYNSAVYAPFFLLPLTVYSLYQFFDGYVFHRYDMDQPLTAQTEISDLPRMRGVQIDEHMRSFLQESDQILRSHGFQPGDPLLSFYDRPGLVYAVQAVSVGEAWFVPWLDRRNLNCSALAQLKELKPKRLFLVVDENDPRKAEAANSIIHCLCEQGYQFPQQFEPIGELHDPNDQGLKVAFYAYKGP